MEWSDTGIVIGTRKHGEASAIVELMTREHGRHLGIVRGGAGSRLRPVLQPGNSVAATWRARLDEHLGNYTIEGLDLRAGSCLTVAHAVYGVTHLAALCRLLPERDPHRGMFEALEHTLAALMRDTASQTPGLIAALVVQFELMMLIELGFGLDLSSCAATGQITDLIYVSPKSGRAVSREAGEPWRDRLLMLPPFLRGDGEFADQPSGDDIAAGFALSGYFLDRHVYSPRNEPLPDARLHFITAVTRALTQVA
jgi:DNA repair protein RecO (recombination protein O)